MQIPTPKLGPFAINLNTIVVLVGFASGFVAWGFTLASLTSSIDVNKETATRLSARVAVLEENSRSIDNHELRLTMLESQLRETGSTLRSLEGTLNSLATDLRVTREILERLEQTQRANAVGVFSVRIHRVAFPATLPDA